MKRTHLERAKFWQQHVDAPKLFPGSAHPAPAPIIDRLIASGLTCLASKLDERIRDCSDQAWSQRASSTLVSRSELKILGRGNMTHVMQDSLELTVASPGFSAQTIVC